MGRVEELEEVLADATAILKDLLEDYSRPNSEKCACKWCEAKRFVNEAI